MTLTEAQKEFVLSNRKSNNIYRKAEDKFFMLPALLVEGEFYKESLSATSKLAWAVLNSRMELSKKNGWFDSDGDIYFVYSNEELMEVLNIGSTATVTKIKKELEYVGLLEQRRVGFKKPNRLYLYHPVPSITDAQQILKNELIGELTRNNSDTPSTENRQQVVSIKMSETESNEETDFQKREIYQKNKKLIDYSNCGVASNITDALFRALGDVDKVRYMLGILFQAKKHVSNYTKRLILLEELPQSANEELEKVFLRCLKKKETTRELKDSNKYIFIALQNFFDEYLNGLY